MAITPLPPAPEPTDSTAQFNSKAFAWVGAIDQFTTEANALAVAADADATTAVNAKNDAEAARDGAIAAANVTKWISGTTYAEGAVIWSPVTFVNYRRKTAGGGTTDPSSDSTNWEQVTGTGNVSLTGTQTLTNKTIDGDNNTITNIDLAGDVKGTLPLANGGTGLTSSGTSGNVLTSNGSSWVSQTPVLAGQIQAIATGTIANGAKVIINSDGTVSTVGFTVTLNPPTVAANVVFESAATRFIASAYDSTNNKIVIAYRDDGNSGQGTAVVGTVSGGLITFGTPVAFKSNINYISATFDSTSSKIIISFQDAASNTGRAIVGTVSGTSISFGTDVAFVNAYVAQTSIVYDSSNNKVVISYAASNDYGTAVVGTVSGTSISFGTPVVFISGPAYFMRSAYHSTNNKIIIAYRDNGNSDYGTAIVGTVSGTSISFGTATVFESASVLTLSIAIDSVNNKFVVAYPDGGNSSYGTAVVGTVSGTSISFGTPVVFRNNYTYGTAISFDLNSEKFIISYVSGSQAIVGTVSGTSISFGTAVNLNSASIINEFWSSYDSFSGKTIISFRDNNNSTYGTSIVLSSSATNLTAENYIGISSADYTNGQTATIQTVGSTDDAQSGLTSGQSYYVQTNGSLSTTADSPSVFAGTAISATKLIIKG